MGLERRSTTYCGETYEGLVTSTISSLEEVDTLSAVKGYGNYFFGGVLDTGTKHHVLFGDGPNHEIFAQIVRETANESGQVCTAQIQFDVHDEVITGVLFHRDPGEKDDNITIDENDKIGIERRIQRILPLVKGLSPSICESRIDVGWFAGADNMNRYVYLPRENMLLRR
jgi:hypothetical protein